MRDWRSVALLALTALLLGRESARTDDPPHPQAAQDFSEAINVRIVSPVPITIVSPVDPRPDPRPGPRPDPSPSPQPGPLPPDTALGKAGREYLHMIPFGMPGVWGEMADRIERGEITDKAAAVKMHNQLSTSLNAALDRLFAPGVDARGKVTNPAAISVPLRQSAAALARPD